MGHRRSRLYYRAGSPSLRPINYGPELVVNGGMELGNPPTSWVDVSGPDTWERSSVQIHGGSYSSHVNVIGSALEKGFGQVVSEVQQGHRYYVSLWYYISSGIVNFSHNGTSTLLSTVGAWNQYTETLTLNYPVLLLIFMNSSLSAEFYIDDVSAKEVY